MSKVMKIKISVIQSILFALTLFIGFVSIKAAIAQTVNIDPTIPGQQTLTIMCEYPVEREDGTPLAINEITQINFWVTKNGSRTAAGTNTIACQQVYDMTQVLDGSYLYTASTLDTDGRESVDTVVGVTVIIKRIAPPKSPFGMRFTLP